jgi:hypothetical protein
MRRGDTERMIDRLLLLSLAATAVVASLFFLSQS